MLRGPMSLSHRAYFEPKLAAAGETNAPSNGSNVTLLDVALLQAQCGSL